MGGGWWRVLGRFCGVSPVTSDLWMRNPAANWEYKEMERPRNAPHIPQARCPHADRRRSAALADHRLPPPPDPAVASLAALSGPAFDPAYLRTLIPVHEEAVEIAMAATLTADHTELLKWNQRMVERKNAQVRQMLTWLREAGASPAQRNVGVATPAVKKLRGLKGGALERAYVPMMASHLERSVALSRLAATKAHRPELRAVAQEIVRVESQEVTLLRGWLRKWYPG